MGACTPPAEQPPVLLVNRLYSKGSPGPHHLVLEGLVAAVLLLGGGMVALQTAAISTGLPFAIVMFVMCFAVVKGLIDHYKKHGYE